MLYICLTFASHLPYICITIASHLHHICFTLGFHLLQICFTLASLWGHFRVTLGSLWGHFGVTLGSLWAHFGFTLGSLWAYRRRMASVMRIVSPCVRPKRVHKQKILISSTYFGCQGSHEDSRAKLRSSEPRGWEGVGGG